MAKNKPRANNRLAFCEWNSISLGYYNNGSILCSNCKFHRSLRLKEDMGNYDSTNKIERTHNCPKCHSNEHWHWIPPIARVPRVRASKAVWIKFLKALENRNFNHPAYCR